MDMDSKIINAVRTEPCLYINSFDIEERNKGWKQLSEKLQMKDLHLKIRWHLLVQRYQNDSNFKYAKEMDFVEPQSKVKVESNNWEFEITEQDVLETRQDSDECVFLDVEDLEGNSFKGSKDSNVNDETADQKQTQQGNEILPSSSNLKNCDKNVNNAEGNQNKQLENKFDNNAPAASNKLPIIHENEKCMEANSSKSTHDRSEDDIFGELVAAMLKHMDADKKRIIKKDIMNMLLT